MRCTLCPHFSAAPICTPCSTKVDRAKTLLLRGLLLPLAQQYAERDRQATPVPSIGADRGVSVPIGAAPIEPTTEGDTAVSGREGILAEQLLLTAKNQAVKVLASITRAAVLRLLADPRWLRTARGMYSPGEKQQLVDLFTATSATANLLGRARIRGRLGKPLSQHSEIFLQFADAAPLKPLLPEAAIAYFKGLQPGIDLDPKRFGADQRRRAFTLAGVTEQTILEKVKGIIADGLESGESTVGLANKVGEVLTKAGISNKNPAYAELVVRTNILDALNRGAEEELKGLRDTFPYWRYDGIPDGREREGHAIHFGKVFPATMSFFTVRDSYYGGEYSGFNCRCTMTGLTLEQAQAIDHTLKAVTQAPKLPKAPKIVKPPVDAATATPEAVAGMSRKELESLAEQMGVAVGKKSTAALRIRLATDLEQRAIRAGQAAAPPTVSPAPAAPPVVAVTASREAAVAAAYQRLERGAGVTIADLTDATGLPLPVVQRAVLDLMRKEILAGAGAEVGSARILDAAIPEQGGPGIASVSVREGKARELLAVARGQPTPVPDAPEAKALPLPRKPKDFVDAVNLVGNEYHPDMSGGKVPFVPIQDVADALGVSRQEAERLALEAWRQGKVDLTPTKDGKGYAALELKPALVKKDPPIASPERIKQMGQEALDKLPALVDPETGLVSIPKLRTLIDSPDRASFEKAVLDLERQGKIRLVAISDPAKVTPAEFKAAIPGQGNTLYYIEPVRIESVIPSVKFTALPVDRRSAVLQSVADATKVGGFGDNKVFISAAFETAKIADPTLTYEQFQRLLVEASQRGELALGRADLVSIMDPQAVKASATKTVGDKEAHFIIVQKGTRDQAINPLYKATTAARETYEYTPAEYLQDSGAATERSKAITLSIHKRAVEEALAAGKVVPDDVLVAYPDLVQKYRRKP